MGREAGLSRAILLTVVLCAMAASLGGPLGPLKTYADVPSNDPTYINNGTGASYDITGYVFDSRGNKVPNAHVILYFNDTSSRRTVSPTFSGNGDGNEPGWYGFMGIDLGKYTVTAEIVDTLGNVYNGTVQVKKLDDRPVNANVTIKGYVYSPWVVATPTPTAIPVVIETGAASASPLPVPKDSGTGGISPLYALAASPVFIIGALVFMRHKKRPVTNDGFKYVDTRRSQTLLGTNLGWNANTTRAPGLSQHFLTNARYSLELEELIQATIKHHYNDIAVIHRVEKISEKYGIDQFIIYNDIKRIKAQMQRGKFK